MSQRRTLKNVRNTWLEKSRRNLHKTINFGPVNERNAFLRNLKGTHIMRTIKSTKKGPNGHYLPYPNRPKGNYKFNKNRTEAAVYYRKMTNQVTPSHGRTFLGPKLSKMVANIHASSAPNYNFEEMSFKVGAREDISDDDKDLLLHRLYELYGHNNNNSNNNTWSVNAEVGYNTPANAITWIEPATMPAKQTKGRPTIPMNWR